MNLYPECTHQHTILDEEGYECLDCGYVLGHSWGSVPLLTQRLADLHERINEDDGPARWFLNARREYRAVSLRIKALEGATK
jgi:hypothetical protein